MVNLLFVVTLNS